MIDLRNDTLVFTFPEVHESAILSVEFQRTLRIPDDGKDYPLPPGLGCFPLRLVDDHPENIPEKWLQHGGVMLPMYQSEAMWLNFNSFGSWSGPAAYPFAIKIAAGKINAVTGEPWDDKLHRTPQDYAVAPKQPWLDGFCVEKGLIRQFVAMPLGSGYSAEEQLTSAAEHGGVQIIVYPMKREVYERRFPDRGPVLQMANLALGGEETASAALRRASIEMGLGAGGRMRQEIFDDPFDFDDWDREHSSRCFVHLANSMVWRAITGKNPPTVPPTAKEYKKAGLPWFEYYDDVGTAVEGSKRLAGLKSIFKLGQEKGDVPLPENESVTPENIVRLRRGLRPGQVRETEF